LSFYHENYFSKIFSQFSRKFSRDDGGISAEDFKARILDIVTIFKKNGATMKKDLISRTNATGPPASEHNPNALVEKSSLEAEKSAYVQQQGGQPPREAVAAATPGQAQQANGQDELYTARPDNVTAARQRDDDSIPTILEDVEDTLGLAVHLIFMTACSRPAALSENEIRPHWKPDQNLGTFLKTAYGNGGIPVLRRALARPVLRPE
jgi:hypothetical protein